MPNINCFHDEHAKYFLLNVCQKGALLSMKRQSFRPFSSERFTSVRLWEVNDLNFLSFLNDLMHVGIVRQYELCLCCINNMRRWSILINTRLISRFKCQNWNAMCIFYEQEGHVIVFFYLVFNLDPANIKMLKRENVILFFMSRRHLRACYLLILEFHLTL